MTHSSTLPMSFPSNLADVIRYHISLRVRKKEAPGCLNEGHTETPLEHVHWAFSQPSHLSPKERHLRLFERTKRKFLWDGCHDKNIATKDPMFSLIVQIENTYRRSEKKTTRRPFQHLQQRSMSMHSWHVKSGLFSVVQSSRLQHFKTCDSLCTSMESPTKESFQVIKRQVLDLLLNKKVQTSSLVIRRVIGRA